MTVRLTTYGTVQVVAFCTLVYGTVLLCIVSVSEHGVRSEKGIHLICIVVRHMMGT